MRDAVAKYKEQYVPPPPTDASYAQVTKNSTLPSTSKENMQKYIKFSKAEKYA